MLPTPSESQDCVSVSSSPLSNFSSSAFLLGSDTHSYYMWLQEKLLSLDGVGFAGIVYFLM